MGWQFIYCFKLYNNNRCSKPAYSNNSASPSSPATYSQGQSYQFNITWVDATTSISRAIFDFNGTNYTMSNTSNVYSYTLTDLAAGNNYTYYFWANDSAGNSNQTGVFNYTIDKALGNIYCYINNNRSNLTLDIRNSGTSIWLNATLINRNGTVYLYKNDTLINSGSSPLSNYTLFNSVGLYNITTIYSATQNYTSSSETFWVNATDNAIPSLTVLSPSNTSYFVVQLIRINFSASDLSGISSLWYYNTTANVSFTSETYINLTNQGYTFIFYANDSYNNIVNKSISFTVKELAANQTILNDSSAIIGTNTTEIILPTNQSLSTITIPSSRTETEPITLNLGQRIDSNGNMSFGGDVNMTRAGSSANYSVEIPSSVVISGESNWTGEFILPTIKSSSGLSAPSVSGYTTTLEKILSVGSSSELNFQALLN